MVSEKLIRELQQIIRAEYGLELTFAEASKMGNDLVNFFDVLAELDFKNKQQKN